jgi:pentatricopeptide repeat protein
MLSTRCCRLVLTATALLSIASTAAFSVFPIRRSIYHAPMPTTLKALSTTTSLPFVVAQNESESAGQIGLDITAEHLSSAAATLLTLKDLAKQETVQAVEAAEQLLLQLLRPDATHSVADTAVAAVTSKHCTVVVHAWCRIGCMARAEALLEQLAVFHDMVGRATFHVVLGAHARAGDLPRAMAMLERMEHNRQSPNAEQKVDDLQQQQSQQPITVDYNVVLAGYAKQGRVAECEGLLQRMIDRNNKNPSEQQTCAPDKVSYHHLLDALAENPGGRDGAGERAEQILSIWECTYGVAGPVAYNKVLKVWKNSNRQTTAVAIVRSEAILKRMVDSGMVDHISYTSYLATLAAHGTRESAQRAHDVANTMLLANSVAIKPTSHTWNTVLSAWVRCGFTDTDMAPNVVSYSTVMDGWAKQSSSSSSSSCHNEHSVERIERVFERMKAVYAAGNVAARPNFWTYVTLIHAYAKRRDAVATQKAEDLIFSMYYDEFKKKGSVDLKPNTQLVTAVMEAWQKSGVTKGAEKAEALLNWMISVFEDENDADLAPNEYSFSCKYKGWWYDYLHSGGDFMANSRKHTPRHHINVQRSLQLGAEAVASVNRRKPDVS